MCNIAGYVGEKRAAPILIDMLRREEGIDAGYYTGIATVHNGKIYYRKLTGDLDNLLKNTDALDLPGNIGIIHGRTKSGGPDAWSHPFVSGGKYSDEPTVAYVANGNSGIFKSRDPEYNLLAEGLIGEGYRLDSEIELEDGIYNRLSNRKRDRPRKRAERSYGKRIFGYARRYSRTYDFLKNTGPNSLVKDKQTYDGFLCRSRSLPCHYRYSSPGRRCDRSRKAPYPFLRIRY